MRSCRCYSSYSWQERFLLSEYEEIVVHLDTLPPYFCWVPT